MEPAAGALRNPKAGGSKPPAVTTCNPNARGRMPTDIWKIPLDGNGAVRGSYYLRHATEVTDTLGTVTFARGRSVEPVTGRQLMSFVAALGVDVDLEPADDEARAAMGVEPAIASTMPPDGMRFTQSSTSAVAPADEHDTDETPAPEPALAKHDPKHKPKR